MAEFTVEAVGLNREELAGLALIYFPDDEVRAYVMQQYNPERYSSMTCAEILNDMSI